MKLKTEHRPPFLPFLLILCFLSLLVFTLSHKLWAAEVDLKPGDTIGPHNWQRVEGVVGENLLSRIKQGYTFKIKSSKIIEPLKEYDEATEKYSGKTKLGFSTVDPKPVIPGYEHIDWMQIIADEYPRDSSGTTVLEMRYASPKSEDDFYVYVPSLRRIRRVPPIQRCATIAPSEFNYDDVNSFNGKVTDFRLKLLGERKMLGNFSQGDLPFGRRTGDYLPLDEEWKIIDTYVLEITPRNPEYCYPRKVLYLDKVHFEAVWTMIWDRQGRYWKEQFAFRYPLDLADRRQIYSVGTVVITNVQNGRSTLVTVGRNYNYGYRPSFFTLATLQTVMRGGALR